MAGESEFLTAVTEGDITKTEAMLRARPSLAFATADHAKTGLHIAAELNHTEIARLLIDAGADIEAPTWWGSTPLEWAAVLGNNGVAELLLARGAKGYTLIVAAGLGHLAEATRFLDEGDPRRHRRRAAPSEPDEHWPEDSAHLLGDVASDALYSAARNGHGAVVELLLARGANVDAKGVFGGTALHWAAINGHLPMVRLLIERGANPRILDSKFGASAREWAEEGGHREIAGYLRRISF